MKNVLIFILLVTGILTYIFESRPPKKVPEEALDPPPHPVEDVTPTPTPTPELPVDLAAKEAAQREKLKAELAEELRKEIEAEYEKSLPTPTPEPPEVPEVTPIPPTPVPTIEPNATPQPTGPQPLLSIPAMQSLIAEQEDQIKRLRKEIQQMDRALSKEKGRIQSWKSGIQNKYNNETFSKTKLRSELQKITAAQEKWIRENRRQNRRKTLLENLEQNLKIKEKYLQEVMKNP
ncbi:hypothetical protein P0Y35_05910 [Kiritimatiellaeota bacterium B1221]|nr:hypothetical protein [Kiritimatiellaeota bacterium B1221]